MALSLTLLMGSGAMVYCIEPGDHVAIEWVHGADRCENTADRSDAQTQLADSGWMFVSEGACVDQPVLEEVVFIVPSNGANLLPALSLALLYELPELDLRYVAACSMRQSTELPAHPDLPIVQAMILLL